MKSRKALFVSLDKFFQTDKFTKKGDFIVGNETYGKKSFIYVPADNGQMRRSLEAFLVAEGFEINPGYAPGHSTAEVRVSYFKGNRWNV